MFIIAQACPMTIALRAGGVLKSLVSRLLYYHRNIFVLGKWKYWMTVFYAATAAWRSTNVTPFVCQCMTNFVSSNSKFFVYIFPLIYNTNVNGGGKRNRFSCNRTNSAGMRHIQLEWGIFSWEQVNSAPKLAPQLDQLRLSAGDWGSN